MSVLGRHRHRNLEVRRGLWPALRVTSDAFRAKRPRQRYPRLVIVAAGAEPAAELAGRSAEAGRIDAVLHREHCVATNLRAVLPLLEQTVQLDVPLYLRPGLPIETLRHASDHVDLVFSNVGIFGGSFVKDSQGGPEAAGRVAVDRPGPGGRRAVRDLADLWGGRLLLWSG